MISATGSATAVDDRDRVARAWVAELTAHFDRARGCSDETVEARLVAGVPLRFRFAGSGMRSVLSPALAQHAPTLLEPAAEILLWDSVAAQKPMTPFPWSMHDVGPKGEVAAISSDAVRCAFNVGSRMLSVHDVATRRAFCWTPSAEDAPWYERAAPLRTLLHLVLSAEGVTLVHAAAVRAPGATRGAMLAGKGGSGKSTTSLLCLEAGFDFAGDDYAALAASEPRPIVHSLYASAKLSPASLGWFPSLARLATPAQADGEKAVVMLAERASKQLICGFPIGAVIVPRVAGGRSRLLRGTPADALRAIAPTTVFQLPFAPRDLLTRITHQIASVPVWRLELGDDREAIPALVARAVEEA